jgi:zinc transporter
MDVEVQSRSYLLDGHGGARRAEGESATRCTEPGGSLWLVLRRDDDRACRWLREASGIDPEVVGTLLAGASRPRAEVVADGLLVVLRCVDPTPGVDPEDLVSIRIWVEPDRVVLLHRERTGSLDEMETRLSRGDGPCSVGQLVVELIRGVTDRLVSVIESIEEDIDELEDAVIDPSVEVDRSELADLRHRIIGLHRYLLPQAHALARVEATACAAIGGEDRRVLSGSAQRSMRCVEDLDAARNHAAVIQDELANQLAARMNRWMYLVTVFATIFLPLTLITGLLGVNLAGIPAADQPWSFGVLCLLLIALGVLGYYLIRRFRVV